MAARPDCLRCLGALECESVALGELRSAGWGLGLRAWSQEGRFAHIAAADQGCPDVMSLLLDRGADLEAKDNVGSAAPPWPGAGSRGLGGAERPDCLHCARARARWIVRASHLESFDLPGGG